MLIGVPNPLAVTSLRKTPFGAFLITSRTVASERAMIASVIAS